MGNIYWLASYPKSGNTWMRILLTNFLRDANHPADINSLDGGPIASARQVFDDHVGLEASDLTQDQIERYRPFVYEQMSNQASGPLFLKVHDAFTYTRFGYPLISKAATAGVIYLLRNPLDVAVSYAHHGTFSAERMRRIVEMMGNSTFEFEEQPKRLHEQLRQRLLTWSGHVTSWVDEPGLRVQVVRYEDLQADPVATFGAVVRFCGLADQPARIEKAVRFSRFEQVQEQESAHGFNERMAGAPAFFRKGQVGGWREELPPELVEKLLIDHAAVMKRFGYLTENGDLVGSQNKTN